ncbi:MAG TPA: hypothetical protein ENI70_01255, partial [Candidatus Peregrinibacteria bacterium]|nr:hypothetical protein [Candidatus Peregrinibacteria bacterium]
MWKYPFWKKFNFLRENRKKKNFLNDEIEPHEIFLDVLAKKKEKEMGIPEIRLEVSLSERIIKISFALISIVILFFLFKSAQMQIINHKKYLALAEENKFTFQSIQASRGVIYDSKGEQLVFNKKTFSLVAEKNNLPGN